MKLVVFDDELLLLLEKGLTNEVPILKVEAVQLVASHLGIHYVLMENGFCALCPQRINPRNTVKKSSLESLW